MINVVKDVNNVIMINVVKDVNNVIMRELLTHT